MKKTLVSLFCLSILFVSTGCTEEFENTMKDEKLSHEVSNEYTDSIGTHYIEGKVTNENDKEYSYVQIEFVCYDKEGNNLGTALDNTNNLGANETWKFKAISLSTSGEIDHCNFKEVTGW